MVCNSSRRNRSSRLDEKEEKRGGWLVVYYRSPKGLLLFGRRWRATRRRERASHLHQRENRSTECGWNSRLPRTHARTTITLKTISLLFFFYFFLLTFFFVWLLLLLFPSSLSLLSLFGFLSLALSTLGFYRSTDYVLSIMQTDDNDHQHGLLHPRPIILSSCYIVI